MSETDRQLEAAHAEIRRLTRLVDRQEYKLAQTGDAEHVLRAECDELRMKWQGAEERARALFNAKAEMNEANAADVAALRAEVERLRDDSTRTHDALEAAGIGAKGAKQWERVERLTRERDEAKRPRCDCGSHSAPRTLSEEEREAAAAKMYEAYKVEATPRDGMLAVLTVVEKHLRPEPRTVTVEDVRQLARDARCVVGETADCRVVEVILRQSERRGWLAVRLPE